MTDLSSLFPQGVGNITTDNDITDNALIRGDGGAKKAQECSTIIVTDDGEMVNTGQPVFNCQVTNTQENVTGDNTDYSITGAIFTENKDQGNNFSNGTFTAPVTGMYKLGILLRLAGLTADHDRGDFYLETSNRSYVMVRGNFANMVGAEGYLYISSSIITDMDANDTALFHVRVYYGLLWHQSCGCSV